MNSEITITVAGAPGTADLRSNAAARCASTLMLAGYLVLDQLPQGPGPGTPAWDRHLAAARKGAADAGMPLAIILLPEPQA